MLSKLAEKLYWTARYLERIESTARLVSVYDSLLFDLPREAGISWYNLIALNSAEELFGERYKNRDERNVLKFLLADDSNPFSMLSALWMLRENVRTSRDVLPQESWELVNELYLFAKENIKQGINRSGRHRFLEQMVKGCQQINGLMLGTMSRDAPWQFLRIGRNLERADMATRLLDAGAAALLPGEVDSELNLNQVVWGHVLRSSSADLSYRRTVRSAVQDRDVASFLLEDPHFPRSLQYCLSEIRNSAERLPNGEAVVTCLDDTQEGSYDLDKPEAMGVAFREYLNQQQLDLGALHFSVVQSWFSLDVRSSE